MRSLRSLRSFLHRPAPIILSLLVLSACTNSSVATVPATTITSGVSQAVTQQPQNPTILFSTPSPTVPATTILPTTASNSVTETPTDFQAEVEWVRQQFGTAWNIEYPEGWTVNTAGVHEGFLGLEGWYKGHTYNVTFSYPILGQSVDALTLNKWVTRDLAGATGLYSDTLNIQDMTVAGGLAKKVIGVVTDRTQRDTSRVYIWKRDDKNPSLIVIEQDDARPTNTKTIEELLDRFAAGIAE